MEERNRNIKLERSQSSLNWLVGRSKSSRLLQDSLSPDDRAFEALLGYQQLSKSMRLFSEESTPAERVPRSQPQQGGWVRKVIGQVFFLGKVDGDRGGGKKEGKGEEKKKRSSWLPDPERRWPLQGW